jgi:hypothetical protein
MDDADLAQRVRELRAKGSSPKEIARALGVSRGKVTPLIRAIAAADTTPVAEHQLVGCWVSPGWQDGLTFDPRPDWPNGEPCDDGAGGMVTILVAREDRRHRVSMCGYLVDTFCLGVKNAVGPRAMSQHLREFVTNYFSAHHAPPVAVPLELVRQLVFGSVDYARNLGFEPHPDFAQAAGYLGSWTGPSEIGFGRDGKPFYVEGPYDDASAVMRTLERSVGNGNFHFLAGFRQVRYQPAGHEI